MLQKQQDIINKIDNSEEIKRFKELEKQIKNNKEYNSLIDEFNKIENPSNEEIIGLRKNSSKKYSAKPQWINKELSTQSHVVLKILKTLKKVKK